MKIIFVLPSFQIKGSDIIFEIISRLYQENIDVRMTSLDNEDKKISYYPTIVTQQSLQNSLEFFEKADAIISYTMVCAFFVNDLDTKAKKFHLLLDDERKFYTKEVFQYKFPKIDKNSLIVEYNKQKNYLETLYNLPFIFIIPNQKMEYYIKKQYHKKVILVNIGINPELFYPDMSFPKEEGKIRILVEGNLMPWKGIVEINQALSNLHNYELWTISDESFSIKSDKHWKTPTAKELREILSSCDILVKNYREDGTGLLELQAMACGCTVLTRRTNGNAMFCKNNENSLIISELAKDLKRLINNKKLREKLIRGGLQTVQKYQWNIDNLKKMIK